MARNYPRLPSSSPEEGRGGRGRGIRRILSSTSHSLDDSRSNCVWHRSIDSLRLPSPSERNQFPASRLSIRRKLYRGLSNGVTRHGPTDSMLYETRTRWTHAAFRDQSYLGACAFYIYRNKNKMAGEEMRG